MPSEAALNTTLGPFLLGYTAVAILFGITNVQAFMYCMHSWKRDTWKLRSFVLFLWFLDALQMALTAHCVYYYLILKFGDLDNLVTEPVVWSLTVRISGTYPPGSLFNHCWLNGDLPGSVDRHGFRRFSCSGVRRSRVRSFIHRADDLSDSIVNDCGNWITTSECLPS
ncbi:hypothetical protein HETIRDRAFT_163074 [Heterobasidion irregulare TC 32-1]|uniref:Uncharacterized protein n=1 Tax=Heterobasidion irregulare (strain TC 32-1) TaxID=747525 RepID=W4KC11_HETIT|nr:uncharacterized protein HETIRDRAFT_163074 [Heterobasidion irregulare TC 32-1]ETW83298.1 hypothetical protein HETIRDRAFT_163074 [Heterobasidion irregulare TC 32-1]